MVSVDDTDLTIATAVLTQRAKMVAEPVGAASAVVLLSSVVDAKDEHVAAVVSSSDVGLSEHAELAHVGMQALGCAVEAHLGLDGWPAAPDGLLKATTILGTGLDSVEHIARTASNAPNRVPAEVRLDEGDPGYLADILDSLSVPDGVEIAPHSLDERGGSIESS